MNSTPATSAAAAMSLVSSSRLTATPGVITNRWRRAQPVADGRAVLERYGVDQIWWGIQSGVAGRAGWKGVAAVEVFVSHAGRDRAGAEWVAWQLDCARLSVELSTRTGKPARTSPPDHLYPLE